MKNWLEYFIAKNSLGIHVHSKDSDDIDMCHQIDSEDLAPSLLGTPSSQPSELPLEWETFVKYINRQSNALRGRDTLDKDGRWDVMNCHMEEDIPPSL